MIFVIGAVISLAILLTFLAGLLTKEEKQKQILAIVEGMEPSTFEKPTFIQKIDKMLAKILPSQLGIDMLEKQLRQAGKPFNWDANDVTVWRMILFVSLLALSIVAETDFNGHIILAVVFGGTGFFIPNMLIWSYKSMRQAKIKKQLRGFQMMLALILMSGMQFEQALQRTIQITTSEFRNILEEMARRLDFRATIPEAFEWLSDETGIKEIERLTIVVKQAVTNGSSLGFALQGMIKEYDNELQNKIERLAQSVNLKVTLTVLFLIVGPSILFDIIMAGITFFATFEGL